MARKNSIKKIPYKINKKCDPEYKKMVDDIVKDHEFEEKLDQ